MSFRWNLNKRMPIFRFFFLIFAFRLFPQCFISIVMVTCWIFGIFNIKYFDLRKKLNILSFIRTRVGWFWFFFYICMNQCSSFISICSLCYCLRLEQLCHLFSIFFFRSNGEHIAHLQQQCLFIQIYLNNDVFFLSSFLIFTISNWST